MAPTEVVVTVSWQRYQPLPTNVIAAETPATAAETEPAPVKVKLYSPKKVVLRSPAATVDDAPAFA